MRWLDSGRHFLSLFHQSIPSSSHCHSVPLGISLYVPTILQIESYTAVAKPPLLTAAKIPSTTSSTNSVARLLDLLIGACLPSSSSHHQPAIHPTPTDHSPPRRSRVVQFPSPQDSGNGQSLFSSSQSSSSSLLGSSAAKLKNLASSLTQSFPPASLRRQHDRHPDTPRHQRQVAAAYLQSPLKFRRRSGFVPPGKLDWIPASTSSTVDLDASVAGSLPLSSSSASSSVVRTRGLSLAGSRIQEESGEDDAEEEVDECTSSQGSSSLGTIATSIDSVVIDPASVSWPYPSVLLTRSTAKNHNKKQSSFNHPRSSQPFRAVGLLSHTHGLKMSPGTQGQSAGSAWRRCVAMESSTTLTTGLLNWILRWRQGANL
ncbi:hypothetical protein BCR44DRAFT_245575 [Catenaria anguillulae PL171]|uniref:Uncharacterized protein n=1 Tax=Catenaria anguillulae PL171 TaxID=765915 RepID=A0A1Y2HQL3_9FUNG|nr:hypothetical protein BCR44DRAFT_245575 [Catenaria anguillulae PL171]